MLGAAQQQLGLEKISSAAEGGNRPTVTAASASRPTPPQRAGGCDQMS